MDNAQVTTFSREIDNVSGSASYSWADEPEPSEEEKRHRPEDEGLWTDFKDKAKEAGTNWLPTSIIENAGRQFASDLDDSEFGSNINEVVNKEYNKKKVFLMIFHMLLMLQL